MDWLYTLYDVNCNLVCLHIMSDVNYYMSLCKLQLLIKVILKLVEGYLHMNK